MNRYKCTTLALAITAASAQIAVAQQPATPQTPTPQVVAPQTQAPVSVAELRQKLGEPKTIKATVSAIDYDARVVTLRDEAGKDSALYVGSDVSRFKDVKVGDRITATYYMSLATEILQPGQTSRPGSTSAVVGTAGSLPGGTVSEQVRWLVTVDAVDQAQGTVTVTGERGRSVTFKAADPSRIAQLKPGDRLEVTLTGAVIVNMER